MEQHAFENVNNYINTNIYSYLETSGGQSSNLFLNAVQFFNTRGRIFSRVGPFCEKSCERPRPIEVYS